MLIKIGDELFQGNKRMERKASRRKLLRGFCSYYALSLLRLKNVLKHQKGKNYFTADDLMSKQESTNSERL